MSTNDNLAKLLEQHSLELENLEKEFNDLTLKSTTADDDAGSSLRQQLTAENEKLKYRINILKHEIEVKKKQSEAIKKMSSSDESSKIDILDSAAQLKKKIQKAFCEPGNIKNNGFLSLAKYVLFPLSKTGEFIIERKVEYGGRLVFNTFQELEDTFAKGEEVLHPGDLKASVEKALNALMEPIRKEFECDEYKKLIEEAYPVEKKKKH